MTILPWATAAVLVYTIAAVHRLGIGGPALRRRFLIEGLVWSTYWVLIAAAITSWSAVALILPIGAVLAAFVAAAYAPDDDENQPENDASESEENFGWMV